MDLEHLILIRLSDPFDQDTITIFCIYYMIIFLFLLTRPDQLMAGGVLPVILEQHLIIRQRRACPAQPIMFQVQSAYDLS